MQYVYGNAWCTIGAAGAASSFDGLFFDRDPHLITLGWVDLAWEEHKDEAPRTGPAHFFTTDAWDSDLLDSPLYQRAWTLQERWLSRRILYFGRSSLFFECGAIEASEMFPAQLPRHFLQPSRTLHRLNSSLALRHWLSGAA